MPSEFKVLKDNELILQKEDAEKPSVITDFRSEEVQDIISERPGFWGRCALPVFLLILLLIVAGTWFIRYPDTIKAIATLDAINGPRAIVPVQEGKLTRLFVKNGDSVAKGDVIGWIESTGSHQQIINLSHKLDSALSLVKLNRPEKVSPLFQLEFNDLGELQPDYQQFITALQQFNDYLLTGYYYTKKAALMEDISFLKKNRKSIQNQVELTRKDMELATKDYNANKKLYAEKVISALKYRQSKSTFLNKQQSIPQLEQAITANFHQQADKEAEIAELEHTISKQKKIFTQSLHTLKSIVAQWIKRYVISAPVTGILVFPMPLQENAFIRAGKTLGYVNPSDSKYYARVQFSQTNLGKAAVGQLVQLRLRAYPYQQFGILEGRVSYISKVASDSGFLGRITLANGLETEYHRQIQFRNGLRANAIIISKPMRLLQRFYYNIVKNIDR